MRNMYVNMGELIDDKLNKTSYHIRLKYFTILQKNCGFVAEWTPFGNHKYFFFFVVWKRLSSGEHWSYPILLKNKMKNF